ncbi:hypothetical protein [Microbacterium sp.]|uniref:hypothetical protein n=1 Tax=Microbacterium sp. TaxID=51671 RepID=UPI002630C3C1|nr:hypothetical protein [Microbacterium sp.]
MQITSKWRRGVIAAAAAVAVAGTSFGLAAPAMADPIGSPVYRDLAGGGSDTIQDVMNGLGAVVTDGSGTLLIGSYDATGSATIKTKSTGATFTRPDGSGDGFTAFKAAKTSTAYKGTTLSPTDLQFSRSSSGPSNTTPTGTYVYVPLALDAVDYATAPSTAVPGDIPLGTSVGELSSDGVTLALTLKNIYSRSATTTLKDAAGVTHTVGAQGSGADIIPFIPQAGSGTRSFWQSQMGGAFGSIASATFTYTTNATDCATNPTVAGVAPSFNSSTNVCTVGVQEHNGTVTAKVTNAIVPFSIAQWVAQSNSSSIASDYGITVTDRRNSAVLGKVNGVNPTVGSPAVLNTGFPIVRPVFNIVKYDELSTNANLAAVFQGASAKAYTALNPVTLGSLVIEDFGFGDITGGVNINGVTYTAGDTTSAYLRTNG